MCGADRLVLVVNDECLSDSALRGGQCWACFQISLHLSAEMADLQNVDYLSMFFRSFFCEYCDWNIKDFVMLLNFPTSKVRILDLLRFERVYSLFSASFLFASKLIRMYFAVSLLSPRTLPNYFPVPFVPPSSLLPFAPLASPLAPPPPSHSLAHAREGYSLADPPSLLGSSRLVKNGDGHNLSLIRHDNSASSS